MHATIDQAHYCHIIVEDASATVGPRYAFEKIKRPREHGALVIVEQPLHGVDDPSLTHASARFERNATGVGQRNNDLAAVVGIGRARRPSALLKRVDALAHRLLAHLFEISQG